MAKIYSLISGEIIRLIESEEQEQLANDQLQFDYLLEFDSKTNPTLPDQIKTNWNVMRLVGNELRDNEQLVIINPTGEEWNANVDIKAGYPTLPDWVKTWTATQAQQHITNNVWQGQTKAQVDAWIDANVTGNNVATLRTNVIIALKLIAGAIIDLRDLMALQSKLIVYLRDLILRFKKL